MGYVVITGASKGIGKALALEYAKHGYNLLLIARSEEDLKTLKRDIESIYSVTVKYLVRDITNNPTQLFEDILKEAAEIEIVIQNAGVGCAGEFYLHSMEDEQRVLDVNVNALTTLTHAFSSYFVEVGGGTIVLISSVGSMMPGPYIATYYATKSYITSFGLSIAYELKEKNVHICVMNLPRVETEFDQHAGRKKSLGKGKKPSTIASLIYKKEQKKRIITNLGFATKMTNLCSRILPKKLFAKIIKKSLSD